MTNAVDLSGIIPADTAILSMLKPGTAERTGWDITMAGPGHPQTIALGDRGSRKALAKNRAIEMAQANGRKWKSDDVDVDGTRREFVEDIVARIVTWTPVQIDKDKPPIEFAPAAAVEMFLQPRMLPFFNQVVTYLTEEGSFIPASEKK